MVNFAGRTIANNSGSLAVTIPHSLPISSLFDSLELASSFTGVRHVAQLLHEGWGLATAPLVGNYHFCLGFSVRRAGRHFVWTAER